MLGSPLRKPTFDHPLKQISGTLKGQKSKILKYIEENAPSVPASELEYKFKALEKTIEGQAKDFEQSLSKKE